MPDNNGFLAVTRVSEWGSHDALAGVRLEHATPIEVKWPDGVVTRHRVKLRTWGASAAERGLPETDMIHVRAGIVVEIHGAKRRVNLLGLMARRLTEREFEEGSVLPWVAS